ncbi:MAG: c-type cytochrome [Proteobacteria bacterium]|nr:c-type cytochrome [Pseudomonadota bacterium]
MRALLISIFGMCMLATAAAADETAPANLANACAGCHGTDGKSPGQIPMIAGMAAADLAAELRQFKNDQKAATVMNRIAKGYTEAEIDAIANYFGGM